jgi:hypothetical protein
MVDLPAPLTPTKPRRLLVVISSDKSLKRVTLPKESWIPLSCNMKETIPIEWFVMNYDDYKRFDNQVQPVFLGCTTNNSIVRQSFKNKE